MIDEYLVQFKPQGKVFFFFDEIQEISGWEKVINSLRADDHIFCEIFISGSNSHLLSSELATYITGRYLNKEIYPFSFEEYLGFFKFVLWEKKNERTT